MAADRDITIPPSARELLENAGTRLAKMTLPFASRVYLFDESRNTHGTIKDRRSRVIIEEAQRLHVDKLVLITSGNSGYSLAKMARGTGIKVVCVVSRRLDETIKDNGVRYRLG